MPRSRAFLIWLALGLSWCVGILGRGYWTPDEPREADIAWRMSWQPAKAVPLLAGGTFFEKTPLTYWGAGAPIEGFRNDEGAGRPPKSVLGVGTAAGGGLFGLPRGGTRAGRVG